MNRHRISAAARRAARRAGLATAGVLVAVTAAAGPGPVAALHLPLPPDDPAVAAQWVNPQIRPTDRQATVTVNTVSVTPDNPVVGDVLAVTVTVTNNSSRPVEKLSLRLQHARAATGTADATGLLAQHQDAYGWMAPFHDSDTTLAPGESTTVTLRGATGLDPAPDTDDLLLHTPGTYPLMVNVNGAPDGGSVRYLDSDRMLVTIAPAAGQAPARPGVPVSALYPITATTGIVPGQTGTAPQRPELVLTDERLAEQIAPGGRLDRLVDIYRSRVTADGGDQLRQATCLAIDPALVDTIDRMRGGYGVADRRDSPVAPSPRLHDAIARQKTPAPPPAGTGAGDARVFVNKLSQLAQHSCVVALPWANADLNAVAATGNPWLFRQAVAKGDAVLGRVLGGQPLGGLVVPPTGYLSPAAAEMAAAAAAAGPTASISDQWEAGRLAGPGAAAPAAGGLPPTVIVADTAVRDLPRAGVWRAGGGVRFATADSFLTQAVAATGSDPLTLATTDDALRWEWRIDSPVARDITARSMLRLAAGDAAATAPGAGVLVVPPNHMADPQQADGVLASLAAVLNDGTAVARPLAALAEPAPAPLPPGPADGFGAPFSTPAAPTDTEIQRSAQQATYTLQLTRLMVNDPHIALTRYQFTEPLLDDLLAALSTTERRSLAHHVASDRRAEDILTGNKAMLQQIRSSVALLPPGTVYTRISDSSPLLIIGRNGLPLPVDAKIDWQGPVGTRIEVPDSQQIPAKGSITIQFTATLPQDLQLRRRAEITMWLSTADGAPIADPVELSVQTRAGITGNAPTTALLVGLAVLLVWRLVTFSRRRRRRDNP